MKYKGAAVSAFTGMVFFGIALMTPGMIIPELDSRLQAIVAVIFPIGLIVGALLSTWLTDKSGFKFTMSLGSLFMAAGSFIAAAASPYMIVSGIVMSGIGSSILNCTTSTLISDISSPEKRTANVSMVTLMFSVGATLLTVCMSIFAGSAGYGAVLVGIGVLALLQTMLQVFSKYPAKGVENFTDVHSGQTKGFWRNAIFLVMAVILFLNSGIEGAVNNWLAEYIHKVEGFSIADSRNVMVFITIGYAVIRVFIAAMERRVGKAMIVIPAIVLGIAGFAAVCISGNLTLMKAGAVLSGIGTGVAFPMIISITGGRFRENSGTAISGIITVSLIGNTTFNLITGYWGSPALPAICFAAMALVTILFIMLFLKLRQGKIKK